MTGLLGRLTIRTQLALLNAAVLAVGGSVLLAYVWASVRDIIEHNGPTVAPSNTVPSVDAASDGTVYHYGIDSDAGLTHAQRFAAFEQEVMDELMKRCLILFALVCLSSLLASWWMARGGLSRISRVTAAARDIGDRNLDARLALIGPNDEVKELADTFDAMLDRLERSFADQRRFTAHASHELRTPLTLQRTALEIPLSQGRIPSDLLPDISRALAATERSERLIAALLALAKGESGVLLPVATDLADEARRAITNALVEAREAEVSVDAQLQTARVWGDSSLLSQLVGNLVTNAVRHNRRHGSVRIETGPTDEGGGFVDVVNSGPVIQESDLPMLFEPFQRGSGRRKGAGLGLSVIRAVTAAHRGTLEARANPTGGLRIRVKLPPQHLPAPDTPSQETPN
ncbi:ATP-binding protein [Streptomyces sp. RKAG293]|uniref:sensor histidine kinase n=1 Tax=Streptomyces sp. RKAG293 TaxID=2893403 RepID=UPI0020345D97|nr:ATP-binding protein [Streptomyces sp. RKAG293]MCM2422661.1 ATP-binding protein [Streptomyces sp. RKAG293]